MEQERFQVAFIGGVFAAGELVIAPLREQVMRLAKRALSIIQFFAYRGCCSYGPGESSEITRCGVNRRPRFPETSTCRSLLSPYH